MGAGAVMDRQMGYHRMNVNKKLTVLILLWILDKIIMGLMLYFFRR
jgi:hypothetical protein